MLEKHLPALAIKTLRYISLIVIAFYVFVIAYFYIIGSFDFRVCGIRIYLRAIDKPLEIMAVAGVLYTLVNRRFGQALANRIKNAIEPARNAISDKKEPKKKPLVWSRDLVAVPALFFILAITMTWPVASGLGKYLVNYGDPVLNSWVLWEMNENILHNPLDLMEGSIFYPYEKVMSYTENLIAGALLVLPVHILSGSPIVEYNVLLILSFALNGIGTYFLTRKITGSTAGSILAGMIFAFSLPRYNHMQHLQMLCSNWIPLSLLFWIKYLERPSFRNASIFILFTVLTFLSNLHFTIYLTYTLLLWAAYEITLDGIKGIGQKIYYLVGPALIGAILILPVFLPYMGNPPRDLHDAERYTNSFQSFFNPYPGSWVYASMAESINGGTWFVGIVPIILTLIAITALFLGKIRRRRTIVAILLIGFLAGWASLGPDYWLYQWLYDNAPGFNGIRAIERVAIMSLLAVAVLSGVGLSIALKNSGRWATLVGVVLCTLFIAESVAIPKDMYMHPKDSYLRFKWLSEIDTVQNILYLPMLEVGSAITLASAYHGKNIMNGYSGYFPPLYRTFRNNQWIFPTEEQIKILQAIKVDHILLDSQYFDPNPMKKKIKKFPELSVVEEKNGLTLVKIEPKKITFDREKLLNGDMSDFFNSDSIEILATFATKPKQVGPLTRFTVQIENRGTSSIPAGALKLTVNAGEPGNTRFYERSLNIIPAKNKELFDLAMTMPELPDQKNSVPIIIHLIKDKKVLETLKYDLTVNPQKFITPTHVHTSIKPDDAGYMLDNNLGTRWSSYSVWHDSMWLTLEFDKPTLLHKITFINVVPTQNDHPTGVNVYTSDNGSDWQKLSLKPTIQGDQFANVIIVRLIFDPFKTRYLKIAPTGLPLGRFWSIHELLVQ